MFSRIVCFLAFLAVSFAAIVDPLTAYGYEASAELERVKVTSDGGITKIVLKQGNGKKATTGANIDAHYVGKLAEGAKDFDSSRKRGQPFSFPLGKGRVIKGWDQGFAQMTIGEKAILVIESEYGYGARGAGGAIPGGATLYFEVELLSASETTDL